MSGFQERWIAGKTVERLEPREKRLVCLSGGCSDNPEFGTTLVYNEACIIHFTDGSRLVLLANEDQIGPIIHPKYYPAKRRK